MTVRSITRCNRLFSAKTANPLVSMIRLSAAEGIRQMWRSGSGRPEGRLLCFHASVFDPLGAGGSSGGYSFFKYDIGESLHLSCREKAVLEREMDEIDEELSWGVDEYCHAILAGRIRLLLDYASRFYGRQFILRHDENLAVLDCTDRRLGTFFRSGKAPHERLPSAELFARLFQRPVEARDREGYGALRGVQRTLLCRGSVVPGDGAA